jgi:hypothetical protein
MVDIIDFGKLVDFAAQPFIECELTGLLPHSNHRTDTKFWLVILLISHYLEYRKRLGDNIKMLHKEMSFVDLSCIELA